MASLYLALVFAVLLVKVGLCSFREFSLASECFVKPHPRCTNETCVTWTREFINCSHSPCGTIPVTDEDTVKMLVMTAVQLRVIKRNYFRNMKCLVYLDLSNCSIECIESGSFDNLINLEILNLSSNPYLESYPNHIFSSLHNLVQLFLTGIRTPCDFRLDILQNLTRLEVLWFGSNQFHHFPHMEELSIPRLKELSLEDNNIVSIRSDSYKGLRSLQTLNLKGNRILAMSISLVKSFPRLVRLDLDRNILFTPGNFVFQSRTLRQLHLNYITSAFPAGKESFRKIRQLEELSLEHSTVIFKVAYPFGRLPNLIKLNLRGNEIRSSMIGKMMKQLPKLRYLDLSNNDIVVLNGKMFQNVRLEVLLLNDNWLSSVSVTSFPGSVWNHLQRLDFSGNAFECGCGIVWFRRWLNDHRSRPKGRPNVVNVNNTRCVSPAKVKETPVHLLSEPTDMDCFAEELDLCLGAVFAIVIIINISATVASSLYRFRWHLKYYHFKRMTRKHDSEPSELCSKHYIYDAFICYSEEDRRWVLDFLRFRLESDFHLKLCVQDRDWSYGEEVLKNFADSIENSRKTVLVLSNAFAVSPFSHFEMTVAQTRFIEDDRDNLVLVLKEEITGCNMNPVLNLLLQQRSHIEWTKHAVGREMFWAKLEHSLKKPSKSLMDTVPPRELFLSINA